MALVNRKRLNSTLREDNYNFVTEITEETGLNQSKIFDLAIDILRLELKNSDLLTLMNKINNKQE